jgi:hypothetical protein
MITGRCECGRVNYHVDSEINDYSHCHCSQCRRLHGAAFASFAGVSRAAFVYDSGEEYLKCYASSKSHGRVFCGHCGSNILVELQSEPESLYLAMGTMEGNPPLPPGYHIYVGSKASWYSITDDLPQYDTEPDD